MILYKQIYVLDIISLMFINLFLGIIMNSTIKIQGARTHNLKNINLEIPRNKLVVITGLSGSGKSSLALNTLYAEGQRRYVESLSAYARQFLSIMEKPDVDYIEGLSPSISIEQKKISNNPRSTVGTITEIYDYLRLLYARVGEPFCPTHKINLKAQSIQEIVNNIFKFEFNNKIIITSPIRLNRKGEHTKLISMLKSDGYTNLYIDGILYTDSNFPKLNKQKKHNIEILIDRVEVVNKNKDRIICSVEECIKISSGIIKISKYKNNKEINLDNDCSNIFSTKHSCPLCDYSLPELSPRLFSFNSPIGACPECDGLGIIQTFSESKIIKNKNISLSDGAIPGWDINSKYRYQLLKAVASHYNFSLNTKFIDYSDNIKNIILHGNKTKKFKFSYDGNSYASNFEGIIPNIERRFRETDSEAVREIFSKFLSNEKCNSCSGLRLCLAARNVFIADKNISSISSLTIENALFFLKKINLSGNRKEIYEKIISEIINRLSFLKDVGLNYISLDRKSETLSGGESQRIRLASQIGAGLVGVMYVLDEPTIGLHQKDNNRLLNALENLKNIGNSVIVIEHDSEVISKADFIVDIGPGAGVHGGEIVATGNKKEIIENHNSLTGKYLSGEKSIKIPITRRKFNNKMICISNITTNNLKNITVNIPVGIITCITGVSGSGKSSLINDTLFIAISKLINNPQEKYSNDKKNYTNITGYEYFDKIINIDQTPIGKTPHSNPATYVGLFTSIRELFSSLEESKFKGYKPGRFSFNVKGGRCEECNGDGVIKVEMHFLADLYITCDNCKGKRYNEETLNIKYKNKNISEVLNMNVEEAYDFFSSVPSIKRKLKTLLDVGLSYISLGQSSVTLSGGEAQRIKLSKELSKRDTGNTLYILDEPTTGLHFHDVNQLLSVIHNLCNKGNTIVIIEHNLDVIKTSDWVIDLGPDGGDAGGMIVAEGSPENVAKNKLSYTGAFLKTVLT